MFIGLILVLNLNVAHAGIFDWITGNKVPKGYPFRLENAAYSKNPSSDWKITKAKWSKADETAYQNFILRLAAAVENRACVSVQECLSNPAVNSFRNSDPVSMTYYADCADFPYYLRAYFSWKNGLPFSFASQMQLRNVDGNKVNDIRYSQMGNEVLERTQALSSSSGKFADAFWVFSKVTSKVSSAMLRVHYAYEPDRFPDFYPVTISRESLTPGTVLYDPNGHVTVIYKVTEDGRIYYIDAHPDNSLTVGFFSKKYARSSEAQGAGFKKFRPIELVDYTKDFDGNLIGGRLVAATNRQVPHFGVEQFFGTNGSSVGASDWTRAEYVYQGLSLDYYEWVRAKLSVEGATSSPVDEMKTYMGDICEMLKDRVIAVDNAITAGMHVRPAPKKLPLNIYGTEGDWENYSSPSRDSGIRILFKDLLDQTKKFVTRHQQRDPRVDYRGANLAWDLLATYHAAAASCRFSYRNSMGQEVELDMEMLRKRLFKLSFDPYHCPELRWGAEDSRELASCQDSEDKLYWYQQQQYLRNQLERRYDVRMDYTAAELSTIRPGVGEKFSPDTDVIRYLTSVLQH